MTPFETIPLLAKDSPMYVADFSNETGRWYVVNLRTGMRYGLMEGYGTREEAEAIAAMFDDGFEPMMGEVEEPTAIMIA